MDESKILNNKIGDVIKLEKIEAEPKETEEHYRIFAAYQHAISELRKFYAIDATFEQMIQKTLDLIIEKFGYYMVWYAELIEEEKVILPKLWAGKYEKYLDGLRLEYENDKKDAKCAMSLAIIMKKPFGYADIEHDKDFEKWRAFALKYGYRSNQAIPLIINGKCKSAFLIYSTRPFAFSEKLIEHLKGIINELATIIENITMRRKTEEMLRKARNELEIRVIERTTELVKINEALRKSEEKHRALTENTTDLIFMIDSEGKVLSLNKSAAMIFGKKDNDIEGKTIAGLFPQETAKRYLKNLQDVFRSGKTKNQIKENMIIGKKENFISTTLSPVKNYEGKTIAVIGVSRNITEQKKAENTLRESEEKFRTLAEQSPNIICIMRNNEVLYVNKRVEEITGYKREILYRPNFDLLTIVAPKYIKTAKKNIATCMKGKNIPSHEFAIIDKEGNKIEMINSIKSIIFEKERALLIVAIDITVLKKTEENLKKSESELKKQKSALEQKNIALREIVQQIEIEKNRMKENITINVKELLLPILEKLKMKQSSRKYIDLLQHHIEELTSSFGYKITKKSVKLTPREIEICNMIKGGLSTKEISKLLSLSTQTIETHRKSIRKKFGLDNKNVNLVSYLYQL